MTEADSIREQTKKLQISWADGTNLSKHFAALEMSTPLGSSFMPPLPEGGDGASPLWMLGTSFDRQTRIGLRTKSVLDALRRELVAGRLNCVGQRCNGDHYWLEQIESDFWIGADILPTDDRAEKGAIRFDEIRIISMSKFEPAQTKPEPDDESPSLPANGVDTPDLMKMSKEEIRQLAIDRCASPNQLQWWEEGKDDRRKGYFDYLAKAHRFEPRRAYGYGADSWEGSENRYKKSRGLLKPKSPNR